MLKPAYRVARIISSSDKCLDLVADDAISSKDMVLMELILKHPHTSDTTKEKINKALGKSVQP